MTKKMQKYTLNNQLPSGISSLTKAVSTEGLI